MAKCAGVAINIESEFPLIGDTLQNLEFVRGSMVFGAIVFSIGAMFIYYVFIKTNPLPAGYPSGGLFMKRLCL